MLIRQQRRRKNYSPVPILLLLCFLGLSSLAVWSTEVHLGNNLDLFIKHIIQGGLALSAFVGFSLYDYRRLQKMVLPMYLVGMALLLAVLFLGPEIAGSRRWIFLGGFSFQPSELFKLILLVTLATHLSRIDPNHLGHLALVGLHVLLPFLLVFKEPDLGTSLMITGMMLGMLLVSPISVRLMLGLSSPALSLVLALWWPALWVCYILGLLIYTLYWYGFSKWKHNFLLSGLIRRALLVVGNLAAVWGAQGLWATLEPYQKQRIFSFLSPTAEVLSSGYQVMQAKIAVGAGGFWGRGLFQGSQTQLKLVPEQHTDFIFSAIAEEFGFIGCCLVLALFAILIIRVLMIAFQCQQPAELYMCTGAATLFLMHILINIGMNIDLLPVTGVPLPLLSYGGTAMVIHMSALGLVESIRLFQNKRKLVGD